MDEKNKEATHESDRKLFYFFMICIFIIGLAGAVDGVWNYYSHFRQKSEVKTAPVLSYIPQFVLLSFDGSKSVEFWRETRAFEEEMNATSTLLHFTYFINAAYFITPDRADLYEGPHEPRGKSAIGFSEGPISMRDRILEVNKAVADGDEIASHTVGHFSGAGWNKEDWLQEFGSFNSVLFGIDANYPDKHFPKLDLKPSDIVGFRAPSLSIGPPLYQALFTNHVLYDSSEVAKGDAWPTKDVHGTWHIPLGRINLDNNTVSSIAMDYNIWIHETNGEDVLKKGTPEWTEKYDDVLASYLRYFNSNYSGNRAPVLVGHHFETWNDGIYWDAMKEFARQVCAKPQVRCGTFHELVNYMNEYGVPKGVK